MWRKKASTTDQRRPRRNSVSWAGQCWVRGDPEEARSACMILDVSHTGALLIIPEGVPVHEGERLVVEVERIGSTPVMFKLHATVRNINSGTAEADGMHVGVTFTFGSALEERIAKTLLPE